MNKSDSSLDRNKFDESLGDLIKLRKELRRMANHTEDPTREAWLRELDNLLDRPMQSLQVSALMQDALEKFMKEDVTV